jgi:hypothetical protein
VEVGTGKQNFCKSMYNWKDAFHGSSMSTRLRALGVLYGSTLTAIIPISKDSLLRNPRKAFIVTYKERRKKRVG